MAPGRPDRGPTSGCAARASRPSATFGGPRRDALIDAAGLLVAPGFIDPHTHAEGARLTDPQHAVGLRQGITTEFLGIDGISCTPLSPANYRV
jgi:N-acyl-D-aspartate/D-glutamate deacylase